MIEGTHLVIFMSAALVLAVTPGPSILYVLGRTLNGGSREGVLSALGTFVGGAIHALGVALGLSMILMTSAAAFATVRYAGAAYLIYLGISIIRNRRANVTARSQESRSRQNFFQGIATEVLNSKTALFFLSFSSVSPRHGIPLSFKEPFLSNPLPLVVVPPIFPSAHRAHRPTLHPVRLIPVQFLDDQVSGQPPLRVLAERMH